MNNISDLDDWDRRIMQLRAIGYSQDEISNQLGISQPAVAQRINKIRLARNSLSNEVDKEKLFWTLLLGVGLGYLINEGLKKR